MNSGLLSKFRAELMGIAALMILICHANVNHVALPDILYKLFIFGNLGVDIFLFVSGFGLYYSLKGRTGSFSKWYKRRYLRILVPYLLIGVLFWTYDAIVNQEGWNYFVLNLSTLSYWLDHRGAWYVALLLPLYLMTPLLYKMLAGKRRWLWTVLLAAAIMVFSAIPSTHISSLHSAVISNIQFALMRVPSFIIGMALGPSIHENKKISFYLLLGIPAVLFVLMKLAGLGELTMFLKGVMLIVIFVNVMNTIEMKRLKSIFRWFGDISLESYLCNIFLSKVLLDLSWNVCGLDLSYGNYLEYACVLLFGTLLSVLFHKISKRIIKTI